MANLAYFIVVMKAVDTATEEFRRAAAMQAAFWAAIENAMLERRVLDLYESRL